MVSREELRRRLWPTETYVDFDHSLNIAITKLRHALSDCAESPLYIETLVGSGYRLKVLPEPQGRKKVRLAILPFANLGGSRKLTCFGEGLCEEIITRLVHFYSGQLDVTARTSATKYKGTTKSITQIGRELKADYLLTGGVRGFRDQLRVTA